MDCAYIVKEIIVIPDSYLFMLDFIASYVYMSLGHIHIGCQ